MTISQKVLSLRILLQVLDPYEVRKAAASALKGVHAFTGEDFSTLEGIKPSSLPAAPCDQVGDFTGEKEWRVYDLHAIVTGWVMSIVV